MAPGLHWRHDHCAWPGFLLVTGTLRAPALKEPGLAPCPGRTSTAPPLALGMRAWGAHGSPLPLPEPPAPAGEE